MSGEDPDALHEAAHLVAAHVVGRKPLAATVARGSRLAGCAQYTAAAPIPADELEGFDAETTPFVLWPEAVRRRLEAETLIVLAGDIARELFSGPGTGRMPDRIAETVAEDLAALELPPAGEQDLAWAAAVVDAAPYLSDREAAGRAAFLAVGRDAVAVSAWLTWMTVQARTLVQANESTIRALAAVLAREQVLGEAAIAAVITGQLVPVG